MKRGLKGDLAFWARDKVGGSRDFPDEEGTERLVEANTVQLSATVPETSPMKRGLKGNAGQSYQDGINSSRDFPDEEGTERPT